MKEFICMQETVPDTQKKIRTWVSSGYQVEIAAQTAMEDKDSDRPYYIVVTSLWRWK